MNEKGSVRTVLVRRKDVEELLEQFNEHAHSSWSDWLGTRIRELPTLTVKGELRLQGHDASSDPGDDLNEVVVRTLRSIARSLDQLTKNLRSQLEDGHTAKEQKTNGDWLRSMTDEGLLEALACEWPCTFTTMPARTSNAAIASKPGSSPQKDACHSTLGPRKEKSK